jgi:hypothetical protein
MESSEWWSSEWSVEPAAAEAHVYKPPVISRPIQPPVPSRTTGSSESVLSGLLSKNRLNKSTLTNRLERSRKHEKPPEAPPLPETAVSQAPASIRAEETTGKAVTVEPSSEVSTEEMTDIINGLKKEKLLISKEEYNKLKELDGSDISFKGQQVLGRVSGARQLTIGAEGIGYEVYRTFDNLVRKLSPSNDSGILLHRVIITSRNDIILVDGIPSNHGFMDNPSDIRFICYEFNGNYFTLNTDTGELSLISPEVIQKDLNRFGPIISRIESKKNYEQSEFLRAQAKTREASA